MNEPLKMPAMRPARPASYCSVQIECFCQIAADDFKEVGKGTAFFYRIGDAVMLVTNWHVLAGRHPDKPGHLLPDFPQSPTHIRWHMATKENPLHFLPGNYLSLYDDDGAPIWIEAPKTLASDLACIRVEMKADAHLVCVQDFVSAANDEPLEVGMDVVVIGFPFPIIPTNPFPIWKRAMVASEPRYSINGRFYTFLDTPARPGMSGSPVYRTGRGFLVTEQQNAAFESAKRGEISSLEALTAVPREQMTDTHVTLSFVGVYSGAYGEKGLERLGLGRFWPAVHLVSLFRDFVPGTNPFPPERNGFEANGRK